MGKHNFELLVINESMISLFLIKIATSDALSDTNVYNHPPGMSQSM